MQLRGLLGTQESREATPRATFHASFVLSNPPACIHNSIAARCAFTISYLESRLNGTALNEWILERVSEIPTDFAGADNIITNLAKERELGIEIIERTP